MILVAGDFHNIKLFKHLANEMPENSVALHVGDAGVGFVHYRKEQNLFDIVEEKLKKKNSFIYVVRGNHDAVSTFKPDHSHNLKYSNIKFVSDYTYLNIENKNILMVGGAISIDRFCRTSYVDYWPDEGFVLDEIKIKNIPVDILITHSSGNKFPPYIFSPLVYQCYTEERKRDWPGDLIKELNQERRDIQKLIDIVKPKRYYFGHFHEHFMGNVDDIFYRCLAINEIVGVPDIIV